MFGSEILDVALGLALIFMLLSLAASAVREWIEGIMKTRAVYLEQGIRELLDDPSGTQLTRWFYEHPLIHGLFRGNYVSAEKRRSGGNLPSYIPAGHFAAAVIDLARHGPTQYTAPATDATLSLADLRLAAARLPSPLVSRALITAIDGAQGDLTKVHDNLRGWFDGAMDRVSGWYKRRTQLYLFLIGLLTAGALQVNTLTIANYLWHNDTAREGLAKRAAAIAADTTYQRLVRDTADSARARQLRYEAFASLDSLDLPLGWDRIPPPPAAGARTRDHVSYYLTQILGILLTAFAIMLGAPFWFDVLNKIMVIRSTVKPREKSPEEGSEDRQPPRAPPPPQQQAAPVVPPGAPPPPPPPPPPQPAQQGAGRQPASPALPPDPGTPQVWAPGAASTPDEGII